LGWFTTTTPKSAIFSWARSEWKLVQEGPSKQDIFFTGWVESRSRSVVLQTLKIYRKCQCVGGDSDTTAAPEVAAAVLPKQ
jgi:hypothetical protein